MTSPTDKVFEDIRAERDRQITAEGWTPEHDDEHDNAELSKAAAAYAMHGTPMDGEPQLGYDAIGLFPSDWDRKWFKPGDRRRNLVKACALLAAEIEREDRKAGKK